MYTVNQDDVHPVIGESNVPGLWACNGFSGHGFKFSSVMGRILSDLAIDGKTTHHIDFLRLSRFKK